VGEATSPTRPSIPLASSHLLINGPRDHTVSSEIKRELASADRIDLLVSFLKWSGWRLLRDEACRFLDRHPGGLRVLTTTYRRISLPNGGLNAFDARLEIRQIALEVADPRVDFCIRQLDH
jgi:hypothetical protein